MGEEFACRSPQGRFRAEHACRWGHWSYCRLLTLLPSVVMYVCSNSCLRRRFFGTRSGLILGQLVTAVRFWGWTENQREIDMDMREMVQKVKRKEPLYGESVLTPYMQGVAARNSRYSQIFFHVMPWFNLVNHNQVRAPLHTRLRGAILPNSEYSMVSTLPSTSLLPRTSWRESVSSGTGGRNPNLQHNSQRVHYNVHTHINSCKRTSFRLLELSQQVL